MKKLVSLILTLCILVSVCSVAFSTVGAASVPAATTNANLAANVQDGQILQCWNWSFNNIKNNMGKIAEQGFSAIQTSPIQGSKESTKEYYSTMQNSWWVYYQPINFNIETNSYNALGTKSEFKAMCDEAEKYGIKVIVDAVLNHTANNNTGNTVSTLVPSDLRNDSSCWHDISKNSWYESRWDITQFCMEGIPDLNTGNTKVQSYAINFLKECIDAGADGFRFDGAKHIEVPSDYDYASDFWPNVLNATTSYAQSTKGFTPYYYGEILDGPSGSNDKSNAQGALDSYMKYMSVTQSSVSNSIRNAVNGGSASGAIRSDFYFDDGSNAKGNKSVLWNESHDTYIHGGSGGISTTNMNKTWALVGSRAEAAGMYMARPSSNSDMLGNAGMTGWTNKEVKAVNQFKNQFIGQSEYLSSSGSIAYNERGTTGAVLVNCGGTTTYADVKANKLTDGTYTDAVTGNKFTVSYGYIKGNIGSTGVAVITKDGTTAPTEATKAPETTEPTQADTPSSVDIYFDNSSYNWSSVYAYVYSDATSSQNANWPGVKMKLDSTTGYYKYNVPSSLVNGRVIFTESSNATTNRYPADQQAGLAISGVSKLFKANHSWSKYTAPTTSGTLSKLSKTTASIVSGKTTTAKATITGGTVTWKSSNTTVATVKEKSSTSTSSTVTITAKKPGTSTITCTHSNGTKKTIKVTVTTAGLALNKTSASIYFGKTTTAKATFKAGTVTWKSSDSSVASVAVKTTKSTYSTVTITAKKIGTATITCTHSDGTSKTLDVTVTSAALALSKTNVSISAGKTTTTKATFKAGTVKWKSSDTSVATVAVKTDRPTYNTVTITGVKVGTATITCTHSDGTSATVNVTVTSADLKLDKTSVDVYYGKTATAKASYKSGVVTWKSSDTSIATVTVKKKTSVSNTAKITGKKVGTATITCTHSDGTVKTLTVTVLPAGLTLEKTATDVYFGKTTTVKASYKAGTVTWTSNDTSIATVTVKEKTSVSNTAKITGKKVGTTTITCTHSDGTVKTLTVTVLPAGLTLDKTATDVYFGKTTTVKASYKAGTVTWTSSDTSIATVAVKEKTSVSNTATITGKKVGTTTITCTHSDGTTATITVTVLPAELTLSKTTVSLSAGKTTTAKASYKAGTVVWTSSDTSVATVVVKEQTSVSNTVTITGVKAGTATITCTHADGTSKTITVTVN